MTTEYGKLRTFGFPSNRFEREDRDNFKSFAIDNISPPREGDVRVFDNTCYFDIPGHLFRRFFPNDKLPYNAFYYSGDKDD